MAEEVEMCVEIASKIDNTWIEKADINLLCRACATETNENMIPIFEGTGLELDLQAKIDKHLPVKITKDDGLPNKMCVQCASTLVAWHDIYTGCTDAETKLKNLLNKSKDNAHTGDKVAGSSVEHEDPVTQKPESQQKVAGEMEVDDNDSDYIYEGDEDDDDYVQDDDDDIDEDGDEEQETEEVVIEKLDSKEKGKTVEITDKGTIIRDQVLVLDVGGMQTICLNLHRKENNVTLKLLSGFHDSSCLNETFLEELVKHVREYYGLGDIDIEIDFDLVENEKMCNSLRSADNDDVDDCKSSGQSVNTSDVKSNLHCNLCNKCFASKRSLKAHNQIHSDKKYVCDVCGKKFSMNSDFKTHQLTHSDSKPYECQICHKNYKLKRYLRIHQICSHKMDPKEVAKNVHDTCNKTPQKEPLISVSTGEDINSTSSYSFSSSVSDKKDISSAGQSSNTNVVSSNLHCNLCNKCFASKRSLKAHNQIHSDKKYVCDVCGKKFSMNSDFKTHQLTHSDSKPYECQICHEKYKLKRYLRIHQIRIHKMDPKEVAKNVYDTRNKTPQKEPLIGVSRLLVKI